MSTGNSFAMFSAALAVMVQKENRFLLFAGYGDVGN
jgi:hypothetical protein